MLAIRLSTLAAVLAIAGAAQAQNGPGFLNGVPGGSITDTGGIIPGANALAARPPPPIAGPIPGRQFPAFPSSIQGRWSASASCQASATQLILTNGAMELRNRTGRLYYANIAYRQDGTDTGVQVVSAPQVNRMGSAGGLLGDTYLFRSDSANRIVPLAIMRSTARRDRVGESWPAFYRCR